MTSKTPKPSKPSPEPSLKTAAKTSAASLPAKPQAGILGELPDLGRYLFFTLGTQDNAKAAKTNLVAALTALRDVADGKAAVVGVGLSVGSALNVTVPGLRGFPSLTTVKTAAQPALKLPADTTALWCWLRSAKGEDQGHLLHRSRHIEAALAPAFKLTHVVDGFCHARSPDVKDGGRGRDLTGYEDGTENPKGKAAHTATVVAGQGEGLDGSSFVAVQQWLHDWQAINSMAQHTKDASIGRRQSDNEELEDAPASAHIKRTTQEDFNPEAFVTRRSMPWVQGQKGGLLFVAFGRTLDAFEVQMRRMAGLDDGIVDAVFSMSKPVNGAYFWCPPLQGKRLDLRQLGITPC